MRDNYVGDVGDFFKYGLLKALIGADDKEDLHQLRLGIAWYLYPDPCNPGDGLHLDYLTGKNAEKFRSCDPVLHDGLNRLVQAGDRTVQAVRERKLLPAETLFYESPLSLSAMPKGTLAAIHKRLAYRAQWLKGALAKTADANLVFFDPDNGLEVVSTSKHSDRGPKFTFYDELLPFWQRGQSLVIYQHKNMHESSAQQIACRKAKLEERLPNEAWIEAIYFPKWGGRIFFIVANASHSENLERRLATFKNCWAMHLKQ